MNDDKVSGPLSHDQVRAQFASGQIKEVCLIWGRSQNSWLPITKWMKDATTQASTDTSTLSTNSQQMWHYAIDGDSKGPMPRVELVNELKSLHQKSEVLVWTKGMSAWADLFEFHDLLDEIGINRREHPRAKIDGSIVLKFNDKTIIGLLKTISPGGFGAFQLGNNLAIGQVVSAEIKSEQLNSTLSGKAVVQYTSDSGFYGFKFQGLNMEAKAYILEFIKSSKSQTKNAA